jgi:hypothetical protein
MIAFDSNFDIRFRATPAYAGTSRNDRRGSNSFTHFRVRCNRCAEVVRHSTVAGLRRAVKKSIVFVDNVFDLHARVEFLRASVQSPILLPPLHHLTPSSRLAVQYLGIQHTQAVQLVQTLVTPVPRSRKTGTFPPPSLSTSLHLSYRFDTY